MIFRTLTAAVLSLVVPPLVASCADPSTAPAASPALVMVGEWTHSRALNAAADPPSLSAGLSVSIVVDSARGRLFWGHVSRWFVGDVGLAASQFGPVSGTIDSSSGVVMRIAATPAQASLPLRIDGQVTGDLLTVQSSWSGAQPGPFPQGCRFQRLH